MIDATEGVTHQDQRLAERIDAAGCPVVVVLNKWELLDAEDRADVQRPGGRPARVPRRRAGAQDQRARPARACTSCCRRWPRPSRRTTAGCRPGEVNEVIAGRAGGPARTHGGRVLYATQGATDPPTFTLFANRTLPAPYLRYLERSIREAFDFGPPRSSCGSARRSQ